MRKVATWLCSVGELLGIQQGEQRRNSRQVADPHDHRGTQGYAICTTPRSGSNFLGQLLTSTGVLGHPLEYFNGPARRMLDDPSYPDDPIQQVERIRTTGTTPNGVYGLKLFPPQLSPQLLWTQALPNLRFIYLERTDILGQAISWVRAVQTGQWRSTQIPEGTPAYDGSLILDRMAEVARENARWSIFFARTGLEPLRMTYERVVETPETEVNRVAAFVGVAGEIRIDPSRIDLTIQRESLTEEWRKRFRLEFGSPDHIDEL